eukprot:167823-Chlamydomonas_euryale.AAC.1
MGPGANGTRRKWDPAQTGPGANGSAHLLRLRSQARRCGPVHPVRSRRQCSYLLEPVALFMLFVTRAHGPAHTVHATLRSTPPRLLQRPAVFHAEYRRADVWWGGGRDVTGAYHTSRAFCVPTPAHTCRPHLLRAFSGGRRSAGPGCGQTGWLHYQGVDRVWTSPPPGPPLCLSIHSSIHRHVFWGAVLYSTRAKTFFWHDNWYFAGTAS